MVISEELKAAEYRLMMLSDILRSSRLGSEASYLIFPLLFLRRANLLPQNISTEENANILLLSIVDKFKQKNPYFNKVFSGSYTRIIHELPNKTIQESLYLIDAAELENLSPSDFSQLFDYLVHYFAKLQGKGGGAVLPKELSQIIVALANIKPYTKVYNPFAGTASLATYLPSDTSYTGQELHLHTWTIGKMRLFAHGLTHQASFRQEDSIMNWNSTKQLFDSMLAAPPFRPKIPTPESTKQRTFEGFLIEQAIKSLTPDGKAVFLVPHGILFKSGVEQELRQELIKKDLLEMVISFPSGLLYGTSIPCAIIVLNKNKARKGQVSFVDATEFVSNVSRQEKIVNVDALMSFIEAGKEGKDFKTVSHQIIKENDFNLNPRRITLSEKIKGIEGAKLGNLLKATPKKSAEETSGKYISIKDLSNDFLNAETSFNAVESTDIPKRSYVLEKSALLLAKRGNNLKATFYQHNDQPIFISNDILAFSVNEKIEVAYLIHELSTEYVQEQLEFYRVGAIMQSISTKDLMKVKIRLPKLETQKAIVLELRESSLRSRAKELGLEDRIQSIQKAYRDELSIKKHRLSQHLNNVKSSISGLRKFLNKNNGQLNAADLINRRKSINVEQHLDLAYDAILLLGKHIKELTYEQQFGQAESIQLKDFLESAIQSFSNERFEFEDLEIDEHSFRLENKADTQQAPLIYADKTAIQDLFNNIVWNAVNHGFLDPHQKYIIRIKLQYNPETEMIEINFSNNGKPFPKGMTKERFMLKGEKAGKTGNTGIGGYKIKSIVDKYGGLLEIISDETALFPVSIIVGFPLNTDNHDV